MMNTSVEEKLISFKTLEQKIFDYVCELGGRLPGMCWKTMIRSFLFQEIQNNFEIKEGVKQA